MGEEDPEAPEDSATTVVLSSGDSNAAESAPAQALVPNEEEFQTEVIENKIDDDGDEEDGIVDVGDNQNAAGESLRPDAVSGETTPRPPEGGAAALTEATLRRRCSLTIRGHPKAALRL